MAFKIFHILSSGGFGFQQKRTIYVILVDIKYQILHTYLFKQLQNDDDTSLGIIQPVEVF